MFGQEFGLQDKPKHSKYDTIEYESVEREEFTLTASIPNETAAPADWMPL